MNRSELWCALCAGQVDEKAGGFHSVWMKDWTGVPVSLRMWA